MKLSESIIPLSEGRREQVTGTRGVTCVATKNQHWPESLRSDFGFCHPSTDFSLSSISYAPLLGLPRYFPAIPHPFSPLSDLLCGRDRSKRMQQEPPPSLLPYLAQRFQSLVWSCLDSDLTKTAVFHAERYYAVDQHNHDSRHLYATALLREGQTYSALCLVNVPSDVQCSGCLEIKAKCCTALGRHRQAREALEATLQDPSYVPTGAFCVVHPVSSYKSL